MLGVNTSLWNPIQLGRSQSLTQSITDTDNDGHDDGTAWDSAAYFGFVRAGLEDSDVYTPCMSFDSGGDIPQGSTITSATLTVEMTGVIGSPNITFRCNDVDTAAQPGSGNLPKNMAVTTDGTPRTDSPTGIVDVDITSAVQELVNRPDWDEAIINVVVKNNLGSGTNHYWSWKDFGHWSGTNPGKLVIDCYE